MDHRRATAVAVLLAPYVTAETNESEFDAELAAYNEEPDPGVTQARAAQILAVLDDADVVLAAEAAVRVEAAS